MKNISVVIEWSENGRIDNLKKPLSFNKANEILSKQHENNIYGQSQQHRTQMVCC